MPEEYTTPGLPPPPAVSMHTMPMAGMLVDVYGLDSLPPSVPVTALWLLHPRTWDRSRMKDIASRTVSAWTDSKASKTRGLVALVFDMPNHGTRKVSKKGNHAWNKGNDQHAVDMAGMVKVAKADMSGLMDLVAGYLGRDVDAHVCLGWSLGGHSAWQAWMGEERVDAVAVVVGCPDYMGLMKSRAEKSELDFEGDFFGSKYFPKDLIQTCLTNDPKAIVFGTDPTPQVPLSDSQKQAVRSILDRRVKGKKLMLLSGQVDKLVPYENGRPFIEVLQDVGVDVDNRVYEGVGHKFSSDMVTDAVEFLVEAVATGPRIRSKI